MSQLRVGQIKQILSGLTGNERASHLIHLRHALKKLAEKGPQPNIHLQIKSEQTEEVQSLWQENGDLSIRE